MSKPYSSLPEALKGITSQMGDNILEDIKLVNILSDVYSIDDIPAAKTILKIMVSEGFCSEVLSSKDDPSWKIKGKMISAKITAQNGFMEKLLYLHFVGGKDGAGERKVLIDSENELEYKLSWIYPNESWKY